MRYDWLDGRACLRLRPRDGHPLEIFRAGGVCLLLVQWFLNAHIHFRIDCCRVVQPSRTLYIGRHAAPDHGLSAVPAQRWRRDYLPALQASYDTLLDVTVRFCILS